MVQCTLIYINITCKQTQPVAVHPGWAAGWAPQWWLSAPSRWRRCCYDCCWRPVGSGCGTFWAPHRQNLNHWSRSCCPSHQSSVQRERRVKENKRLWKNRDERWCCLVSECQERKLYWGVEQEKKEFNLLWECHSKILNWKKCMRVDYKPASTGFITPACWWILLFWQILWLPWRGNRVVSLCEVD